MRRLQTLMNVLVLIFCDILELLMSWVCRYDKVYKLVTASNECVRRRIQGHTCPVEDCPPSFIHQPGNTAS